MDRRLKRFVNEWVNNKKGRKSSLGGILPQGGAVDIGLRMANGFVTLLDLGLNIPVGLTVQVGEQVTSFVNLGAKQYARGLKRMQTEKGKQIIRDNEAFVGKSVWRELTDTANNIGDTFNKGMFFLFETATLNANKIHLLGAMTDAEWEAGKISQERVAQLRRDVGRFRHVSGATSIFGATAPGTILSKYKTWALPILNTILDDLNTTQAMLRRGQLKQTVDSREFQELFRAATFSTLLVFAVRGLIDDDDKSFIGETVRKAYRESLTILGAIDPTVLSSVRLMSFIGDLAASVKMIVTGEKYKTKPGYKGVAKLKRTVVPRALKQFGVGTTEEKKGFKR